MPCRRYSPGDNLLIRFRSVWIVPVFKTCPTSWVGYGYGRECVRVGASFQMFSMVGNPPLGGQYLQDDISSVIDRYVQQRTRLICAYVTSPCCQCENVVNWASV